MSHGPSTRAIHAGLPPAADGEPLLPGPVLAAPYHLRGDAHSTPYGYGRDANPTWTHLERAIGELDGGRCVVFASGMAAVAAVVLPRLRPGDVLVACGDGYPGIRQLGELDLAPNGVEVRLVPTDTEAIVAASEGATLVWVETPSNPRLDTCDLDRVVEAGHAAGALVAVDNTVATPLGLRPLEHGADFAMTSGTKSLTGHADVLLGAVSVRDDALADELVAWRIRTGSIIGPVEAWLAHRSLATLGLRLERSQANARALAAALERRDDVTHVRWPGIGGAALARAAHRGGGPGLPRRVRACQRGDQLRRRPHDRRAPRPLGHRRRPRGLHPLLGRLRGHRRPGGRRRPRSRPHQLGGRSPVKTGRMPVIPIRTRPGRPAEHPLTTKARRQAGLRTLGGSAAGQTASASRRRSRGEGGAAPSRGSGVRRSLRRGMRDSSPALCAQRPCRSPRQRSTSRRRENG